MTLPLFIQPIQLSQTLTQMQEFSTALCWQKLGASSWARSAAAASFVLSAAVYYDPANICGVKRRPAGFTGSCCGLGWAASCRSESRQDVWRRFPSGNLSGRRKHRGAAAGRSWPGTFICFILFYSILFYIVAVPVKALVGTHALVVGVTNVSAWNKWPSSRYSWKTPHISAI